MTTATRKSVRPKSIRQATGSGAHSVAEVLKNAVGYFKGAVYPRAVTIFTPFNTRVPLSSVRLRDTTAKFVARYEPSALSEGLFPHQSEMLKQYLAGKGPHFILTSATGSGKSLCFWTWVFDQLLKDPNATAILCFPTQALMWGQAKRLERISDSVSLARPLSSKVAFGGLIGLGRRKIGWTVWKGHGHGYTLDKKMVAHEASPSFADARIRIATLDKAHFSLIGQAHAFTRNLRCIVIDEAHTYDGMFGANVHFFLKRLGMARELLGLEFPNVFLASATLSDPIRYGSALLALDGGKKLVHVGDQAKQQIKVVSVEDAKKGLAKPPKGGLLRTILLLDNEQHKVDLPKFLADASSLGTELNAIYFTESKFHGRQLALRLRGDNKHAGRRAEIYDGDLPPEERRIVEDRLNAPTTTGMTIIATNALELGVDIEGLDVCLIDHIPPSRQDLLQRIGRVGRRDGRPGLVMLSASVAPLDRDILKDPESAFRLDTTRTLPLPTHVDLLRWRHMLATYNEGIYRDYADRDFEAFRKAMEHQFGEALGHSQLKERFEELYGNVVEVGGRFWAHNGFRASASQGKIPLIECTGFSSKGQPIAAKDGAYRKDVAWIEDTSVFRDAHPEGIFLGHDGRRWQIVAYDGDWQVARNNPAGTGVELGKWLRTIKAIYVQQVKANVATRGDWKDSYKAYEFTADLPSGCAVPRRGTFSYGLWDFSRKWRGYKLVDLTTGTSETVKMSDVVARFQQACQSDGRFPFLHALTYRTFGWRWDYGSKKAKVGHGQTDAVSEVAGSLLERFLTAALECSPRDLAVRFSPARKTLEVFDTTPGGSGLSQAALQDGRMAYAFNDCLATLRKYGGRGRKEAFRVYVARLLNQETICDAAEVINAISDLDDDWNG